MCRHVFGSGLIIREFCEPQPSNDDILRPLHGVGVAKIIL